MLSYSSVDIHTIFQIVLGVLRSLNIIVMTQNEIYYTIDLLSYACTDNQNFIVRAGHKVLFGCIHDY